MKKHIDKLFILAPLVISTIIPIINDYFYTSWQQTYNVYPYFIAHTLSYIICGVILAIFSIRVIQSFNKTLLIAIYVGIIYNLILIGIVSPFAFVDIPLFISTSDINNGAITIGVYIFLLFQIRRKSIK